MKYMGSKNRLAKHLLPIILRNRDPEQWYVEPFAGGANMIDKVSGKRRAGELNKYVYSLLVKMQEGWIPPIDVSEELWHDVKLNKDNYPPHFVAYCGICLSFGAVWFCTYSKDAKGNRNYRAEAQRNILKQAPHLRGIEFINCSYLNLDIPLNSVIYCDPPYKGTDKYRGFEQIDHTVFWDWVREKVKEKHAVYVSEFTAPSDFKSVWSLNIKSAIPEKTLGKKVTEQLFVHESHPEAQWLNWFNG